MTPTPTAEERARQMDAERLAQFDINKDINAYPKGPIAEGKHVYRFIGWEGADRGALLLSPTEADLFASALRQAAKDARAVPVGYVDADDMRWFQGPHAYGEVRLFSYDEDDGRGVPVYAHPVPASAGVAEGLEMAAKRFDDLAAGWRRAGVEHRARECEADAAATRALKGTSHG